MSKKELESCVFDDRDIVEKEYFQKEWINKRITWIFEMGDVYPWVEKGNKDSTKNNTVIVFLSPWGPKLNNAGNLVECLNTFSDHQEASEYIKTLESYRKGEDVRITGIIAGLKKGNMPIRNCIVLEKAK